MAKKEETLVTLDNVEMSKKGVPAMLKIVEEQIKQLRGNEPKTNRTTKAPDGFPKSVNECTTVDDLIKMHSFIVAKDKFYQDSVKALGLNPKNYPTKISGYSVKTWIDDIKFRLNEVKNKTKLEKLNKVKSLLERNLSEEEKFKKEMQEMAEIVKDLGVD